MYVSPDNAGAAALAAEVKAAFGLSTFEWTERRDELAECEHMLLYCNGHTWIEGAACERLAADVEAAVAAGVPLFLAHEGMAFCEPGPKNGCEFAHITQSTPSHLPKEKVYHNSTYCPCGEADSCHGASQSACARLASHRSRDPTPQRLASPGQLAHVC